MSSLIDPMLFSYCRALRTLPTDEVLEITRAQLGDDDLARFDREVARVEATAQERHWTVVALAARTLVRLRVRAQQEAYGANDAGMPPWQRESYARWRRSWSVWQGAESGAHGAKRDGTE
jgi:hypothetical protein